MPIYEGLALHDIMEHAKAYKQCEAYFPVQKDFHKLPRQWILNIIGSLAKDDFQSFVSAAIEKRNASVALNKDLWINLDPAVADAFANSTAISVSNVIYLPNLIM